MAAGKKGAHHQGKYESQWARTAANKVKRLRRAIVRSPQLAPVLEHWETKLKNNGK